MVRPRGQVAGEAMPARAHHREIIFFLNAIAHAKGFAELGGFGENNSSNTSICLFGSRE
jgi:hypothetical protein